MHSTIEEIILCYGEPVYRKLISEEDRQVSKGLSHSNIPKEVAVFKIDHPSKFMVVSRYVDTWHYNHGERTCIVELLKEIETLKAEVKSFKQPIKEVTNDVQS